MKHYKENPASNDTQAVAIDLGALLAAHDAALVAGTREQFKMALKLATDQRGDLGYLFIDEGLPEGAFHKETVTALAKPVPEAEKEKR